MNKEAVNEIYQKIASNLGPDEAIIVIFDGKNFIKWGDGYRYRGRWERKRLFLRTIGADKYCQTQNYRHRNNGKRFNCCVFFGERRAK